MGLIQILTDWIAADTKDRWSNDYTRDPNDPETKAENEDLDRRIEKASKLLDACKKHPDKFS